MNKPKEQDTVRAILQFLAAHRIPAWRVNSGATKIGGRFLRFGAVGMADIIGIKPLYVGNNGMIAVTTAYGLKPNMGRFLAIEVKAAKGRVTPAQQAFLDQVNKAGGRAFVARSVDDVARELGL